MELKPIFFYSSLAMPFLLIVLNGIETPSLLEGELFPSLLIVLNGIETKYIPLYFVLPESFNRTKWN